ncbi:PAS domain-containing protein [Dictyobacter kobayashii]|uniref:PAS domain-containing protein n=1 Tax=Dictyobacter kobayashii TaxID=2014872 RepID=A0A402AD05_9CHLR|nr:PAS domain-containing protein [Dictyobacter kobayashii]GCE16968.1 hypothetical protein KDK_07680 [Dictyobacter kobayashii]
MSQTHIGQQLIDSVAQSVRESSDINSVIGRTLDTIHTNLHTSLTCLHVVDDTRQSYRLLGIHSRCDDDALAQRLHTLSGQPFPFFEQQHIPHQPMVIEDIQADTYIDHREKWQLWTHEQIQSIIFIPLWFGSCYEGMLTAAFGSKLQSETAEVSTLLAVGTYLAAALGQARLMLTVQSEQTGLHTILDQLPEGALIADAVTGSIRYANEVAARLLQIPLVQLIGLPVHQFTRLICTETDPGPLAPMEFFPDSSVKWRNCQQ